MKKIKYGFTLVEIVISLVLVSIIALILVRVRVNTTNKAQENICVVNRQSLIDNIISKYLLDEHYDYSKDESLKVLDICPNKGEILIKYNTNSTKFEIYCNVHKSIVFSENLA